MAAQRVAGPSEASLPGFGNMHIALPSSNHSRNGAMRWIALAGGVAFVLVIMAFPAVMIALSEDARVQYLSLQKQNSWSSSSSSSSSRKDDATVEPTKGLASIAWRCAPPDLLPFPPP
ncbi:uncharacterized protein [Dermacentor albipictus]|uniref:uncharacterized protein n=1 Tax=Dermacentor albipictus TaxID=60249 RepID=UPI0038FD33C9